MGKVFSELMPSQVLLRKSSGRSRKYLHKELVRLLGEQGIKSQEMEVEVYNSSDIRAEFWKCILQQSPVSGPWSFNPNSHSWIPCAGDIKRRLVDSSSSKV